MADDFEKLREEIARLLVRADGEDPDAYHTKAAYESGAALCDHAIPLWRQRQYYAVTRDILAIPAIADVLRMKPIQTMPTH